MLFQRKALGLGHSSLALFDLRIVEFLHLATIEAHQMIVVGAFVELINGLAALKIAAGEQARLLKLREHPIDRGQANVRAFTQQHAIDVFRCHMALRTGLENLHDFQARQSGFQASVFQFIKRGHGKEQMGDEPLYNGSIITLL